MKKLLFVCLFFSFVTNFFSQSSLFDDFSINKTKIEKNTKVQNVETSVSNIKLENAIPNAQMAMSSPDYLVTAGDIYSLAFAVGTTPVTYSITVDPSYKIRVANLGVVNAKGLSFVQLKNQVETIVSNNYPLGGVQFVLINPASFNVKIYGEVTESQECSAWSLTRLSTVVEPLLTDYSSIRNIEISSSDGTKKIYDLFLAERNGDFTNDPYLRPGDKILVNSAKRKVSISGSVKRPGIYELLDGENLVSLIEKYGDGLTPFADTSRICVFRITNESESGKNYYYSNEDLKTDVKLESYDRISISSYKDVKSTIYIEGAIIDNSVDVSLNSISRKQINFTKGEKYSDLILKNKYLFVSSSDLINAYIIRTEKSTNEESLSKKRNIPINLEKILYDANYICDELVHENDVLIVPVRQFFVSVAGAVASPGRFPYIPDRDWNYYVGLAGGIDSFKNVFKAVEITDKDGNKLDKNSHIPPEATITVKSNNAFYKWSIISGGVTAILSAVSTVLSIYMVGQSL